MALQKDLLAIFVFVFFFAIQSFFFFNIYTPICGGDAFTNIFFWKRKILGNIFCTDKLLPQRLQFTELKILQ